MYRFINFETMHAMDARAYVKKPRPGAATTPFLTVAVPEEGSSDRPAKRPRSTKGVAEELTTGNITSWNVNVIIKIK